MSSLVGGTGIIGQDIFCSFGNGKYKTFEGTEISIENCLKARVKDLVVEGKTIQDTEDLSDIESVAEREENLVNIATVYENMLESGAEGSLFNPKSNSAYDVYKMEIQPNTEYLFNLVGYEQTPWIRILDKNNITVKSQNLSSTELNYIWPLKTEDNSCYLVYNKSKTATGTFQVYKKENPYPVKIKINEESNYINLPIPLRSLPNSTCDTIEENRLVQRVEKVTLDENTEFNFPTSLIMANTVLIGLTISSIPKVYDSTISAICDKLQFKNIYNLDESGFFIDKTGTKLWLRLSISIYGSTLEEIKTNLALNPITIYYPLATPIIHNLEIPSISTTKGTNIITTENNIKPKLSMKVKVK